MAQPSFNGLRVLALESRRATEIAALITTFGGAPRVAPSLREVPLESNSEALDFAAALMLDEFDVVVFLTGVGARALMTVVEAACPRGGVRGSAGPDQGGGPRAEADGCPSRIAGAGLGHRAGDQTPGVN